MEEYKERRRDRILVQVYCTAVSSEETKKVSTLLVAWRTKEKIAPERCLGDQKASDFVSIPSVSSEVIQPKG